MPVAPAHVAPLGEAPHAPQAPAQAAPPQARQVVDPIGVLLLVLHGMHVPVACQLCIHHACTWSLGAELRRSDLQNAVGRVGMRHHDMSYYP